MPANSFQLGWFDALGNLNIRMAVAPTTGNVGFGTDASLPNALQILSANPSIVIKPSADTIARDIHFGIAPPAVVSTAPGATLATDAVEFGRARCYTVRSVRGAAAIGEPAPPVCFTPIDVFPPEPPAQPAAVSAQGAISLIWDPSPELDLGGYLVFRREAGGATLLQLTPTPITEARYRDSTVTAGRRYNYTVVAVDSQLPLPNMSAESLPIEETAR